MMVIRAAITQGVTSLPLKRNLVPRFTKEGARFESPRLSYMSNRLPRGSLHIAN
jgi:hypothetical protein